MHPDWLAIVYEYLLQEYSVNLARLDERVGHEVTLRAVRARPAEAQAFLFCSPGLDEDIPRARYLGLYPTAEFLNPRLEHRHKGEGMERTATVSQTSA